MRQTTLASATLLLLLAPLGSSESGTATSSTGDVDTWGISQYDPTPPPECSTKAILQQTLGATLQDCGLVQACPAYIGWMTVRLTLLDPSPGDRVALTVTDPAGPIKDLSIKGTGIPNVDPWWPTDIATYEDPVADVTVQVGGCDHDNTAIVTGLVVDGEVAYTIMY